jgi:hypothetical protein
MSDNRTCGNVSDQDIVAISGSIDDDSSNSAVRNAIDLTNTSHYFHLKGELNQWLCSDVKNRKVQLTHSPIHPSSGNLLRSWLVEGSLDGSRWFVVDCRANNNRMISAHPIGTVTVSQSIESRFIRLRQIGKTSRGDDFPFLLFRLLLKLGSVSLSKSRVWLTVPHFFEGLYASLQVQLVSTVVAFRHFIPIRGKFHSFHSM